MNPFDKWVTGIFHIFMKSNSRPNAWDLQNVENLRALRLKNSYAYMHCEAPCRSHPSKIHALLTKLWSRIYLKVYWKVNLSRNHDRWFRNVEHCHLIYWNIHRPGCYQCQSVVKMCERTGIDAIQGTHGPGCGSMQLQKLKLWNTIHGNPKYRRWLLMLIKRYFSTMYCAGWFYQDHAIRRNAKL